MSNDYVLDGVLGKIKTIIGIEKIDDSKLLIDTCIKLVDQVTLNYVMMLFSCPIKDADKFYLQIFLERTLAA